MSMGLTEVLQMVARLDASQAISQFQRLGREADQNLRSAEGKLDRLGATMMKVGAGMLAGSVTIGRSLYKMSKDASDLNEAINATGLFFGDATKDMVAFGREAYKLGFSTTAALESMGQYGNLLGNMGLDPDEVAASSKALLKLAADYGSALNVDPGLSAMRIAAALRGEYEPARSLGIILSEDAVTAKALEMGLAETKQEVDAFAKAKARLALITEQGASVENDFTNTIDSQANRMRVLKAQWTNIKADLGQAAMPIAAGVMGGLSDMLDLYLQLPAPIRAAGSQLLTFGTISMGALGALSLGIGTVIRFREQMQLLAASSTLAATAVKTVGLAVLMYGAYQVGKQLGNQMNDAGYYLNPSWNPLDGNFWNPVENRGKVNTGLTSFVASQQLSGAQLMQARAAFAAMLDANGGTVDDQLKELFASQLQGAGVLGGFSKDGAGSLDSLWKAMETYLDPQSRFYGDSKVLDSPLMMAQSRGEMDRIDVGKIRQLAEGLYEAKVTGDELNEALGRTPAALAEVPDSAVVTYWQDLRSELLQVDEALGGLLGTWDQWVTDWLGLDWDSFNEQLDAFREKMTEAGVGNLWKDTDESAAARASLGTLLQGLDDQIGEATDLGDAMQWIAAYKSVVAELESEWGQNDAKVQELKRHIDELETQVTTRWNIVGTLDTGGIMAALSTIAPGLAATLSAAGPTAPPESLQKPKQPVGNGAIRIPFPGATGAIVTRPTLALIGEAGPEAVTPLNRAPGASPLPQSMGGAPIYLVLRDGRLLAEVVAEESQAMGGIPLVVRGAP